MTLLEPVARAQRPARRSLFVPNTVAPPRHFLGPIAAARAALCNPIALFDQALFQLPYRDMRRFGRRFVEVMDPTLMHAVLVEHSHSLIRAKMQRRFTEPLIGRGILTAEGDHWRLQRKAAAPCFRARAVAAMAPAVSVAGARAVDAFRKCSGNVVDVMPAMMRATFDVLANVLFGEEAMLFDQPLLDRAAGEYLETLPLRTAMDAVGLQSLHDALPHKGQRAVRTFRRGAAEALAKRQITNDANTLASRLAAAVKQRRCDSEEDDTLDAVVGFLAAGNETAALGLVWALYLIANNPVTQDALRVEARKVLGGGPFEVEHFERLELHLRVLKEALRLFPPLALVMRTATRAVDIGPFMLQAGDEVVCATYVMHRSDLLWDAPNAFDPDRFLPHRSVGRHRMAFLPFGAGPHACIGMPLANLEMVGVLAQLMRSIELAPSSFPVEPCMHLTLRPKGGLHLTVRSAH